MMCIYRRDFHILLGRPYYLGIEINSFFSPVSKVRHITTGIKILVTSELYHTSFCVPSKIGISIAPSLLVEIIKFILVEGLEISNFCELFAVDFNTFHLLSG